MPENIIETSGLTRRFGLLTAVDALDIEVHPGEIFGLLGPNGAGKTTLIKMLTTLLPPSSGWAKVGGFHIMHQARDVRRVIGYVPQMLSTESKLTGYENLLIFAKLYDIPSSERQKRIHDSLSFMGLTDVAQKLVSDYSGGMIRRLEIAQSMLHHPLLLFMDEPTVGLDPVARRAVWDHIKCLRANYGTTIFLTTHIMEEADSLCSRVAIMHLGKIAAIGAPVDLKSSLGGEENSLDDVFAHYAGDTLEGGGSYRETSRKRRNARRLG